VAHHAIHDPLGVNEPYGVLVPKETVLQEANRLVYGDRAADYGGALTEAEKVAAGWRVILGADVEPEHYPLCMAWLKIVRQTNKAKRDNLVDLAGYAGVAEKIETDRRGVIP
jgi:hypothetical protein